MSSALNRKQKGTGNLWSSMEIGVTWLAHPNLVSAWMLKLPRISSRQGNISTISKTSLVRSGRETYLLRSTEGQSPKLSQLSQHQMQTECGSCWTGCLESEVLFQSLLQLSFPGNPASTAAELRPLVDKGKRELLLPLGDIMLGQLLHPESRYNFIIYWPSIKQHQFQNKWKINMATYRVLVSSKAGRGDSTKISRKPASPKSLFLYANKLSFSACSAHVLLWHHSNFLPLGK